MTQEQNLFIEIESGEESYFFTVAEALQLLKVESERVAREKRQDELPYVFGFKFMTDEEYAELSKNQDRPQVEAPASVQADQSVEDWQHQYSDLLEWAVMLIGPLKELVELKQMKDEQGRTAEYEERQPKAWYMARTAIAMWEERGNYGLKLKHETPKQSPLTVQQELQDLRRWKAEAMATTPDFQAIGKELGIPLAQSVHDKILPAIRKLKAELPALPTREDAIDWVINRYGPGPVDVRVKLACVSLYDWLIGQCGKGSVDLVEIAFRRGHQLGYQANQIGESNYENACWEAFKSDHGW